MNLAMQNRPNLSSKKGKILLIALRVLCFFRQTYRLKPIEDLNL